MESSERVVQRQNANDNKKRRNTKIHNSFTTEKMKSKSEPETGSGGRRYNDNFIWIWQRRIMLGGIGRCEWQKMANNRLPSCSAAREYF